MSTIRCPVCYNGGMIVRIPDSASHAEGLDGATYSSAEYTCLNCQGVMYVVEEGIHDVLSDITIHYKRGGPIK